MDSEMNLEMDVTELRKCQAELYESMMRKDTNCMELVRKYKDVIQKEIQINAVAYQCSCGRDIGRNLIECSPSIEEVSEMIRNGECKCNHSDRKDYVVSLTFGHVAASSNNVDVLRLFTSRKDILNQQSRCLNLSSIFIAVIKRNEEATDFLLSKDIDINAACMCNESTVLMQAVRQDNEELVHRLLQFPGIDINKKNTVMENPLTIALQRENKKMFDMLLDAGANTNVTVGTGILRSLLMMAIYRGMEYVTKLLERGVDVNYISPRKETALRSAVDTGNTDIMKILLDAGAEPNVQSMSDKTTPIISAAYRNRTVAVKVLAKGGADVNLCNVHGYNAVHLAAWNGHTDMLKVLLEVEGVEHDKITNDKNSPLGLACHGKHAEAVEMLLPRGCNVDNQDKDRDTALLYATYNGMTDTVRMLLEYGADPDLRSDANVSPLWNAVYKNHKEIVKLLLGENVRLEVNSIGSNHHAFSNVPVPIFSTPRSTLYVAVRNGYTDIIYLLLAAGYNICGEPWLHIVCPELDKQAKVVTTLRSKANQPLRLISICRNYFRGYGNPRQLKELVKVLDLPKYLQNYLLLTDLLSDSLI